MSKSGKSKQFTEYQINLYFQAISKPGSMPLDPDDANATDMTMIDLVIILFN